MNGSTMMAAGAGRLSQKMAIAGRKSSFIFKAGFSGSAFVDLPGGMIYRLL
jgi:hypothetical protein